MREGAERQGYQQEQGVPSAALSMAYTCKWRSGTTMAEQGSGPACSAGGTDQVNLHVKLTVLVFI